MTGYFCGSSGYLTEFSIQAAQNSQKKCKIWSLFRFVASRDLRKPLLSKTMLRLIRHVAWMIS